MFNNDIKFSLVSRHFFPNRVTYIRSCMVFNNLLSLYVFFGQLIQKILHFVYLHPILRQLGSGAGFLFAWATPKLQCWVGPVCFASGRLVAFGQLDRSPGRKAVFGGWRWGRIVSGETQGALKPNLIFIANIVWIKFRKTIFVVVAT